VALHANRDRGPAHLTPDDRDGELHAVAAMTPARADSNHDAGIDQRPASVTVNRASGLTPDNPAMTTSPTRRTPVVFGRIITAM